MGDLRKILLWAVMAVAVLGSLCITAERAAAAEPPCRAPQTLAEDRDNIYLLLAYAIVNADWQGPDMSTNRGYNIGSVLINTSGEIMNCGRNAVNVTHNSTQHGEVRLITSSLGKDKPKQLAGSTVYTTLEPCAMCSGMMTLTQLYRTVYGQTDPDFGKALERLFFNSTSIGGYPPYPRKVISDVSYLSFRCDLDDAYAEYQKTQGKGITAFLADPLAHQIFSKATAMLLNYKPMKGNEEVLKKAQSFYLAVNSKMLLCGWE